MQTTRTTYQAFLEQAAALVAANDATARRAELAVAGDFDAWDDEVWAHLSRASERLAS